MNDYPLHRERSAWVGASVVTVFEVLDDPIQLGRHMNQRSSMMAGGTMRTETDGQRGRQVGSLIRMSGRFLGVALWLEEAVIERIPPQRKVWETRGDPRLLVIGRYRMGFELSSGPSGTLVRIWIDYTLPSSGLLRGLSRWLAPVYADWCLRQMLQVAVLTANAEIR